MAAPAQEKAMPIQQAAPFQAMPQQQQQMGGYGGGMPNGGAGFGAFGAGYGGIRLLLICTRLVSKNAHVPGCRFFGTLFLYKPFGKRDSACPWWGLQNFFFYKEALAG